ncbi:MAG: hypothetical protein D6769_00995 [Methanobacteriota archaeon]|nr:MAG: hypothetical protein D6769_00995 [Euryarchaeota archaeon]
MGDGSMEAITQQNKRGLTPDQKKAVEDAMEKIGVSENDKPIFEEIFEKTIKTGPQSMPLLVSLVDILVNRGIRPSSIANALDFITKNQELDPITLRESTYLMISFMSNKHISNDKITSGLYRPFMHIYDLVSNLKENKALNDKEFHQALFFLNSFLSGNPNAMEQLPSYSFLSEAISKAARYAVKYPNIGPFISSLLKKRGFNPAEFDTSQLDSMSTIADTIDDLTEGSKKLEQLQFYIKLIVGDVIEHNDNWSSLLDEDTMSSIILTLSSFTEGSDTKRAAFMTPVLSVVVSSGKSLWISDENRERFLDYILREYEKDQKDNKHLEELLKAIPKMSDIPEVV